MIWRILDLGFRNLPNSKKIYHFTRLHSVWGPKFINFFKIQKIRSRKFQRLFKIFLKNWVFNYFKEIGRQCRIFHKKLISHFFRSQISHIFAILQISRIFAIFHKFLIFCNFYKFLELFTYSNEYFSQISIVFAIF